VVYILWLQFHDTHHTNTLAYVDTGHAVRMDGAVAGHSSVMMVSNGERAAAARARGRDDHYSRRTKRNIHPHPFFSVFLYSIIIIISKFDYFYIHFEIAMDD